MTHKKRVAFIVDTLYEDAGGGSEKQFILLQKYVDLIGIDSHVIFLRKSDVYEKFSWHNKPLVLNIRRMVGISFIKGIYKVREYLVAHKIETIHCLFDDSVVFGYVYRLFFPGTTFICFMRNLGYSHKGIKKLILALAYRKSDKMVVNADKIKALLIQEYGVPDSKIDVIQNIYEQKEASKQHYEVIEYIKSLKTNYRIVAITIANLRPIKGIDELLEAALICQAQGVSIAFVLVGDGGGFQEYTEKVRAMGLHNVFLMGYQSNAQELLEFVDIAILPSRSEGLSNSLVEYTMAGLAVIATDVGGNRMSLADGSCGVLVEPNNAKALARSIIDLSADQDLREKLGKEAFEYARNRYTPEVICSEYSNLYSSF